MSLPLATLHHLSGTMFEALVGTPLHVAETPAAEDGGEILGAWVEIHGAWQGAVGVICTRDAARLAASAMLEVDAADASETDLHDAVRELANVIGGQVKALLPLPNYLSLPTTGVGMPTSYAPSVEHVDARMDCNGQLVIVRLSTAA